MKRKIVVDVDDVLGEFLRELNKFYNKRFGTHLKFEDYSTYDLHKVWGCSVKECWEIIWDFYNSPLLMQIPPLEFSQEALKELSKTEEFVAASYRQTEITKKTEEWIGDNFFGMKTYCIGNYGRENLRDSKSAICKREGAWAIVEDSGWTAVDCADKGITSLLFSKPWNVHVPNNGFQRVEGWREALRYLR